MKPVALATEDELSEAVGQRLLASARHHLDVGMRLRRGGSGYLRSRMTNWCQLAIHQPVFLLTDLDRWRCPGALIEDWFITRQRPEDLVFRVAVHEIEAWLLADHEGMHRLLGRRGHLPVDPDTLHDPKQRLLQLAKRAAPTVRRDLVAEDGSVAAQAISYNRRLCAFVETDWDPDRASARSESLRRARNRIDELSARLRAQRSLPKHR